MRRPISATGRRANPEARAGGDNAPDTARRKVKAKAGRESETSAAIDPREALRIELRQWSLKRAFVHQFDLIAKPIPPPSRTASRRTRRGGRGESAIQRHYRAAALKSRPRRMAKARHAAGRSEGAVFPFAVRAGWPDQMIRDRAICRTAGDILHWGFKWGAFLSGQVLAVEQPQRPPPPVRQSKFVGQSQNMLAKR